MSDTNGNYNTDVHGLRHQLEREIQEVRQDRRKLEQQVKERKKELEELEKKKRAKYEKTRSGVTSNSVHVRF